MVLPFTGLHEPHGVAVDAAGNLYVTDFGNNRVVKLPAG
jgi:serine/threonine protein kinase, bacterial